MIQYRGFSAGSELRTTGLFGYCSLVTLFSVYADRKSVFAHRQLYLSLKQWTCIMDEILCYVRTVLADPGKGNGFFLITDFIDILKSASHLVNALRGLLTDERYHFSSFAFQCSLNAENTGCNGLLAVRVSMEALQRWLTFSSMERAFTPSRLRTRFSRYLPQPASIL